MDKLRQAATAALAFMKAIGQQDMHPEEWAVAINLEAALAEQPTCKQSLQVEQEPVAWMHTNAVGHTYFRKHAQGTAFKPVPLYTAPQPAKPEPLTDEEIDALELPPSGTATVRDLVRLIERAHGIGETND